MKYATEQYNFRKAIAEDGVALGDNSVRLKSLDYCDIGILLNVMIVPQMTVNLISVSKLDLMGYYVLVKDQRCTITKGTSIILSGPLINGLYQTTLSAFLPRLQVANTVLLPTKSVSGSRSRGVVKSNPLIASALDIELLHKRVGHASVTNVLEGLKTGAVTGYTVTAKRINKKWVLQNGECEHCMMGKSKLPSFPRSTTPKGNSPGEYVVSDIIGPYQTPTLNGETFAITYTDWYSK